jgi:hypothetical protein
MDTSLISEFYKSLTPVEREAHTIAARMLGSSYIVDKTHAFTKWQKKRQAASDQGSGGGPKTG